MRLLIILCLVLSACQTASSNLACHKNTRELIAPKEFRPVVGDGKVYRAGDVIAQSVQEIGQGFYIVHKEVANDPEHWEGFTQYSQIYYGDTEASECGLADVERSSNGDFISYKIAETGINERVNIETGERITLN